MMDVSPGGSVRSGGPPAPRRFEPWPWVLSGMLGAMIATSLGFLAIALTHPDPEVERLELRSTSATPPEPATEEAER
jgi:hypothetical protein